MFSLFLLLTCITFSQGTLTLISTKMPIRTNWQISYTYGKYELDQLIE